MKTRAIGLMNIIRETFAHAKHSDLKIFAGSLAFTTVLGIVPMLAVAFAAIQALGYLDIGASKIEPFIYANLAPAASDVVHQHMTSFLNNTKAGAVGVVGGVGLLLTTLLTFNQFTVALNRILGTTTKQRGWHTALKITVFFMVAPALVALSLATTALLPFVQGETLAIIVNTVALGSMYKILSHRKLPWGDLIVGSAITGVMWEVAKWSYTVYAVKTAQYSKVYGPLSALPLFFLWVYVAWFVVLIGAALIRSLIVTKEKQK